MRFKTVVRNTVKLPLVKTPRERANKNHGPAEMLTSQTSRKCNVSAEKSPRPWFLSVRLRDVSTSGASAVWWTTPLVKFSSCESRFSDQPALFAIVLYFGEVVGSFEETTKVESVAVRRTNRENYVLNEFG